MKSFVTVVLLCLTLFATGCNTMRGVGQDVERAGQAIEDAAD